MQFKPTSKPTFLTFIMSYNNKSAHKKYASIMPPEILRYLRAFVRVFILQLHKCSPNLFRLLKQSFSLVLFKVCSKSIDIIRHKVL